MGLRQNLAIKHNNKHRGRFLTCSYTWRHTYIHRCCDWKGWCQLGWEYESVCMTSLLFTGIPSFPFPNPHSHECWMHFVVHNERQQVFSHACKYSLLSLKKKKYIPNKSVPHLIVNCTVVRHISLVLWDMNLRLHDRMYLEIMLYLTKLQNFKIKVM